MKRNWKVLLGIAFLAAASLVGGTWAVLTNQIEVGNEFKTAYYSTELKENFESPDDWKPGVETEKEVWVSNTGDVPVLTKAVLSQKWIRRENVYAATAPNAEPVAIPPLEGEAYPLTFGPDDEYAAIINFNKEAVVMLGNGSVALSPEGIPYVTSLEEAKGKWLLASETPDADGNWEVYYVGVVEPGKETPRLIESVTMHPKLENTVIGSKTYYVQNDDGTYKQITVDQINPEFGYDCATYTLTVSMTTVQATADAVKDVFKSDTKTEIINYLVKDIAESSVYVAEGKKVLTMMNKNGTFGYVPQGAGSGTEQGNWFMSFTDMIPGGIYKDEMEIENTTSSDFRLYMQAVPREQSEIKDELLDKISMNAYHNGTLIYTGTASGAKDIPEESLQNTVYLGLYGAKKDGNIEVELQLDPSLELEADGSFRYADVLTKVDWKFWVVREIPDDDDDPDPKPTSPTDPTVPTVPTEPITEREIITDEYDPFGVLGEGYEKIPVGVLGATGDDTPILQVVAAMLVCVGVMAFVIVRRKKESYEE